MLVTGIPRAGTSWVGKMIEVSGGLVYVNEPMNPQHPPGGSPGVLRAPIRHRFQYITEENDDDLFPAFQDTVGLRYHVLDELAQNHSPADLLRLGKYWSSFVRGRLRRRRALLDDPFAVFSVVWFARTLGCQTVVVVRHPAAVVSSRKRLRHTIDFGHLLNQPFLVRDWLAPFHEEMEAMQTRPDDLVGQGSLLWRVIYYVVDESRKLVPSLHVVRHEDLSVAPTDEYRALFSTLALPFTERVEREIEAATHGGTDAHSHSWSISRRGLSRTGFRPRDSRAYVTRWRAELEEHEIARVRALTEGVASRYYDESDWT